MPHPTCTTPRPLAGPLPEGVLDQIARHLAEAHAGADHATLVRVRPRPTGVDIGLCALPPGVHPADALLGHVVPPAWVAAGVVAPARAHALDRPAEAEAATVVVLADRGGQVTSHGTGIDGPEGSEPMVGRVPDLVRRTLGLPTEPPQGTAAEWWRACWLDALVAGAAAHPGLTVDRARPLTSTLPLVLVEALVAEPTLCEDGGWPRLRELAALPEPPDDPGLAAVRATMTPFVEPATAAWFDDGSFARWLLAALPSVDELLELAAALVPPTTLDLLHEVSGRRPPDPAPDAPPDPPDPFADPATGEPAPQRARGGAGPPR